VILTPDQRLRVFVSSTLGELAAERTAAREVIESMRLAPVMFELGARPHPPRALYRAYLDQSHVFVAIYGERYGWVAPTMDISGLEDEYRLSGERPKLVYVREPAPGREERLTEMLADVADDPRVTLHTYGSTEELAGQLATDLAGVLAAAFTSPGTSRGRTAPTPQPAPSRLPVATTSLVGRAEELAALTALARRRDVRMVTVTGIGGIGKSRLALEVAHQLVPDFPGGVVLVPMSVVPESGLVLTRIAATLGVHLDSTRPSIEVVAEALADRGRVLVLLDNAEQVPDAASDLANLVNMCPELTFVVTSRKRLRLVSEHDFPLQPLPYGARPGEEGFGSSEVDPEQQSAVEDSDAMRLFEERARAVRPDLDLTTDVEQRRAAVEICRRLEGVPLAIEIAAARSRVLAPTQLLERLDRRLDLPAARLADLPERQRTLRATLDWSRDLLSPAEQDLLAQLSTFVGGASLEAIEQVCSVDDDILEALASLTDHSLLEVDACVLDAPRFTMLETVREYAREMLERSGRLDAVDVAHKEWVIGLAERARVALPGPEHAEWLERLELEAGNVRTAGSRAHAAGDPAALAHVGYCIWLWLWARYHGQEAKIWLERALEASDELEPLTHARLRWCLAGAAVTQGDNDLAAARLREAEEVFAPLGDEEGDALCAWLRASLAPVTGEVEKAIELFVHSAEVFLRLHNVFLASIATSTAGMMAAQLGRIAEAEERLDRGLDLAESIDNAMLQAQAHTARGFARLGRGALDEAERDFEMAAVDSHRCRNPEVMAFACDGLASVQLARGKVEESGALLVGCSAGLRRRAGVVPWPTLRPVVAAIADGVRSALEPEVFEGGFARGRALDIDGTLQAVVPERAWVG
jgi:predicted ATPase